MLGIPDLEEQNKFGSSLGDDVLGKEWYFYMNPDDWKLYLFNGDTVYQAANYQNSEELEPLTSAATFDDLAQGQATVMDFFCRRQRGLLYLSGGNHGGIWCGKFELPDGSLYKGIGTRKRFLFI